ncbi:MAG: HAMP domain-containing histidine kinase, partial [Oscillospiraceae bacterium]|nr:HAMP domain-containing histidine kinase [Oscillospiraceae bacterium]
MKRSIKTRLFFVIFGIILLNIALVLVFGGAFAGIYYTELTKMKLNDYGEYIQDAYNDSDNQDRLKYIIDKCTANNVTVVIYDWSSNTVFSNSREKSNKMQSGINVNLWIEQAHKEGIFSKLNRKNSITNTENNRISDSIYFYSKIDDDVYLMLETPMEFLQSAANMMFQFFSIISIITLIIATFIIYFVSKKIAKPIKQIDRTAQRIAKMDFSERCNIHTGDEIELLSISINKMADQLEQNIDLLKEDLRREEQTNIMRREFIANVSHDLKTPLALITSYSEALSDGNIDEKEAIEVLLEQCNRMDRLVSQMLTLSRLESNTVKYDMTVFSIGELISTVSQGFKLLIDKKDIDFHLDVDDSIVYGDYNAIVQVYTNLLDNSIKYVDDKKQIRVFLSEDDSEFIKISVYNTHKPLCEEHLKNVFEMFYKTDKSREIGSKSYG